MTNDFPRTMSTRIIPITEKINSSHLKDNDFTAPQFLHHVVDSMDRPLTDLRISVTDRCNFRCSYCMPKEVFDKNYTYLPHKDLLSFEEITRLANIFVQQGVNKIRLTGGEPLLRKNIDILIQQLSLLTSKNNKKVDLSLTTNGSLLAQKAQALKDAGLQRLTVSLDALSDATFKKMNDVDFPVQDVLNGIQQAYEVGFKNIKINMVVKAGVNEHEILPMINYFKNTPFVLRMIEYMDVGSTNQWHSNQVLTSQQILDNLAKQGLYFTKLSPTSPNETAQRWQHADGIGEIGFISSVSKAFCGECTRARLSTQGMLYTCLFAHAGNDLKALLRNQNENYSDEQISHVIHNIWMKRTDRYSELRSENLHTNNSRSSKIEMSYIGG